MRNHLLSFLFCALVGVPIGAAGVAYATSCADPAVTAILEPVSVTVDGEPAPLDTAAVDLWLVQSDYGRAALRSPDSSTYILLEREEP